MAIGIILLKVLFPQFGGIYNLELQQTRGTFRITNTDTQCIQITNPNRRKNLWNELMKELEL